MADQMKTKNWKVRLELGSRVIKGFIWVMYGRVK